MNSQQPQHEVAARLNAVPGVVAGTTAAEGELIGFGEIWPSHTKADEQSAKADFVPL